MHPLLGQLLAWTSSVAALLAVTLVIVKIIHRQVLRWKGVRSAQYIAAIGDMVTRQTAPPSPPPGWAHDPVFAESLAGYRLLLSGPERAVVDSIATAVGLQEALAARARRRFPAGRRLQAISHLVDLADETQLPFLRSLLADRNPHARIQGVRGLAQLDDVESIPAILDLLTRADQWEAARISDSLHAMGAAAVDPISGWIDGTRDQPHGPVTSVALAVRVLGLIGDPTAEPVLIDLLRSNQPEWRVAAASALKHCGTSAAVPALLSTLEDRSAMVRARVAVALGATADPAVARPVAALLNDEVWWVRQNAAEALVSLPGGEAYLLSVATGHDRYAADAAVNQLTLSGALARAAERTSRGTATEIDLRLVELASDRS